VHVLLVEDEPDLAGPIARFLEHEGYAVSAVGSVAEARRLDIGGMGIVLLDVMLRSWTGAGVATASRVLRSQPARPLT
jgi:DNA-binding response OmpR family regulator